MVSAVRETVATAVLIVVFTIVHSNGWLGPHRLEILILLAVLSQAFRLRRVNTVFSRGDLQRRLWVRMGVHYLCLLTPLLYLTGWGPVAGLAYITTTGLYIEWVGSRAWRPAVCLTALGTCVGQAGIMTGLLPSYLDGSASLALWLIALFALPNVGRQLGQAVERFERTETRLRESQDRVRRSERWFRALVQNVGDVIMVVDAHGAIRYVSPSVQRQLGYQVGDMCERRFEDTIDARDTAKAHELWQRLLADPALDHLAELRLVKADGTVTWYDIVARNMLHDPDINGVVVNHRDSHERRLQHDDLAHEATHDSLTGLANRAKLQRVLDDALVLRAAADAAGTTPVTVAVLYIDLDGFKPINDRYGHDAGDALLVAVARLLERSVLGADTVARVGGDEFVVVLCDVRRADAPESVANRILENLTAPILLPGVGEIHIGASIGVATIVGDAGATDLLRRADQAMYQAKREGRNRLKVAGRS